MEFVPFGDLGSLTENNALAEEDIKDISRQVLDGLRIMHRLDFVHRDIKSKVGAYDAPFVTLTVLIRISSSFEKSLGGSKSVISVSAKVRPQEIQVCTQK